MRADVSSSPDIPDEAIRAAQDVMSQIGEGMDANYVKAALVAVAPALTRQAIAARDGGLAAEVVAAERERIATAIETDPTTFMTRPLAARIARAEPGTDERTQP